MPPAPPSIRDWIPYSTDTLQEVRERFGASFDQIFWPVFKAFNCLLPAHAPEAERPDALRSFMLDEGHE